MPDELPNVAVPEEWKVKGEKKPAAPVPVPSGKWLRLTQGREEYVPNHDTVLRLLGEGAIEIPDPTIKHESVKPDDSTHVDERPDNPSPKNDQRSESGTRDDGDSVQRPGNSGLPRRKQG